MRAKPISESMDIERWFQSRRRSVVCLLFVLAGGGRGRWLSGEDGPTGRLVGSARGELLMEEEGVAAETVVRRSPLCNNAKGLSYRL